jgi:hypothetical protein
VSSSDALEQKLDLLIALTRLSVRAEVAQELDAIRNDAVLLAILRSVDDWIPAGKLKEGVRSATGQSDMTVKRRIADLVSRGALLRDGAGPAVKYRTSGLFEV